MMKNEMKIILPILPGKSEAWRRFLQELTGSRQADFTNWCQMMGVHVDEIELYGSSVDAIAMIHLQISDQSPKGDGILNNQNPFNRWIHQQIRTLHGLDLGKWQKVLQNRIDTNGANSPKEPQIS